jgi:hypothetical protein
VAEVVLDDLILLWAVGETNNAPGAAAATESQTEGRARERLPALAELGYLEEYSVGGVYRPADGDALGRLEDRLLGEQSRLDGDGWGR